MCDVEQTSQVTMCRMTSESPDRVWRKTSESGDNVWRRTSESIDRVRCRTLESGTGNIRAMCHARVKWQCVTCHWRVRLLSTAIMTCNTRQIYIRWYTFAHNTQEALARESRWYYNGSSLCTWTRSGECVWRGPRLMWHHCCLADVRCHGCVMKSNV